MDELQCLLPIILLFVGVVCHVAIDRRDGVSHFVPENNEIPEEDPTEDFRCMPFVSCPAHVRLSKKNFCTTSSGRNGIRCTTGQNHSDPFTEKDRRHHYIHMDALTIGALNRKCRSEYSELRSLEARLMSSSEDTILFPGPATYGHFRNSRSFSPADLSEVMNVAGNALKIAIATRAFKNRQGITNEELELGMMNQDLRSTLLGHVCVPKPSCPVIRDAYRRIDGTCNNDYNTAWGAPFTPYSRLLPANYEDGVWSPRVSVVNARPLPSPRMISTTIISNKDVKNPDFTLMVMQFGQFISHEVTQSIDTSYANGSAISCCSENGWSELPSRYRHYACMPIKIPNSDNFYGVYKQRCMNFVRSVLSPRHDCTLGYAQQMNKITHFIDGSSVYGSTPEQTSELRSFERGKLKVFEDFGRTLLPLSKDQNACLTMEQGSACFESGDTRTNQMITLVVLHTLFLREHNRIADILANLNPQWNDEDIFLEARQIVIAELQVIIYKEYLPVLLGESAMEEFELRIKEGSEYSSDYDHMIDPSITNEFASAAWRFGHSTVDEHLKVYGPDNMEEMINIQEVMFYPARMRKRKFLDEVLSTLTTEPIQSVDNSLPEALTRYMFRAGNPFGVDLASINIQRGRDHGLRPYNDYRELVGLPRIQNFQEFGYEIGSKLESVYASVDDIDLWIGGLLEEATAESLVGLTFRDIIAEQFARLKKGDRYFFENSPSINPGYFSPDQLRELRKASMSRIICDNSDSILLARQALNAFKRPGVTGNEFVDCRSAKIPRINLIYWQE